MGRRSLRYFKLLLPVLLALPILPAICIGGTPQNAAGATYAQYTIIDDATGGDCTKIGTWDQYGKTCTLTQDLTSTDINGVVIRIGYYNNFFTGITLDGNDHKITGTGYTGVDVFYENSTTVRNLKIVGLRDGITIEGGANHLIENNSIENADENGIFLSSVDDSIIRGNLIQLESSKKNSDGIMMLSACSNNQVIFNTITGFYVGVYLQDENAQRNIFAVNHVSYCETGINLNSPKYVNVLNNIIFDCGLGIRMYGTYYAMVLGNYIFSNSNGGVYLELSHWNYIYNNNFVDNNPGASQASIANYASENFFYDTENGRGGNFWERNGDPENCVDANKDKRCDAAHTFTGGQDPQAWAIMDRWGAALLLVDNSGDARWESYSDYRERILTVTFDVRNDGQMTAEDPRIANIDFTNQVELLSDMPILFSSNLSPGATTNLTYRCRVPNGVVDFQMSASFHSWDSDNYWYFGGFDSGFGSEDKA